LQILGDAIAFAGLSDALRCAETVQLLGVNRRLWDVEDEIREVMVMLEDTVSDVSLERFEIAARKVPELNDERSRLKQQLNVKFDSDLQEVKSYEGFELGDSDDR